MLAALLGYQQACFQLYSWVDCSPLEVQNLLYFYDFFVYYCRFSLFSLLGRKDSIFFV